MKKNVLILTLFAVGTLVASYAAQEGGGNREAIRERILQKFDKDGDGHLSTEERAELRSFIQSREYRPPRVLLYHPNKITTSTTPPKTTGQ